MSQNEQEYVFRPVYSRTRLRVIGPPGLLSTDDIMGALKSGAARVVTDAEVRARGEKADASQAERVEPSLGIEIQSTQGGMRFPIYQISLAALRELAGGAEFHLRVAPLAEEGNTDEGARAIDIKFGADRVPSEPFEEPSFDLAEVRSYLDSLVWDGVPRLNANKLGCWEVAVLFDGVLIQRFHPDGSVAESYRAATPREAAVWLAAISQGFRPPRDLRPVDDL